MLLTNSQIHIFHTVVVSGGFAQAAKILSLDPSTVSKTVARIEDELGIRLINRSTRAFSVTQEGQILSDACGSAMQTIKDALGGLTELKQNMGGRLRVFASSAVAEDRVAPLMRGFHAEYPHMSVEFVISNGYTDPIEAGVDITLSHEAPTREDFVMRKISETDMVLGASPDFLDQCGVPANLNDLMRIPCICSTVEVFNTWRFIVGPGTQSLTIHGPFRASTNAMMRRLALQGLGLAMLTRASIQNEILSGEFEVVTPEGARPIPMPLYAVYHDRRLLNGRIRAFVDFLHRYL